MADDLTPRQRALKRVQDEAARLMKEEEHADRALSGKPDAKKPAAEKPAEEPPKDDPAPAEEPPPKVSNKPPTLADLGLKAAEERVYSTLSEEDVAKIKQAAREMVAKEKRAAERKALMAEEMEQARIESGTLPEDKLRAIELEEEVFIRIALPMMRSTANRDIPPDPIIIDQCVFANGWSGYVSRAQAEYLHDLMGKRWMHQAQVEGRSRTYYNDPEGRMMYQGGYAAGGGGSYAPVVGPRPAQPASTSRRP